MIINLMYLFGFGALFFATLIVSLQNTVYAVFSLILVFFCIFGILLCLGITEFLAIIILIVYIGAVSILFLFTVMMLGASTKEFKTYGINLIAFNLSSLSGRNLYLHLFFLLSFIYFTILNFFQSGVFLLDLHAYCNNIFLAQKDVDFAFLINFYSNDIAIFGSLLYTEYSELFFLITFVMLVTLVGSLVLALCYYKPVTVKDFLKPIKKV